jgi:hypothetical protein
MLSCENWERRQTRTQSNLFRAWHSLRARRPRSQLLSSGLGSNSGAPFCTKRLPRHDSQQLQRSRSDYPSETVCGRRRRYVRARRDENKLKGESEIGRPDSAADGLSSPGVVERDASRFLDSTFESREGSVLFPRAVNGLRHLRLVEGIGAAMSGTLAPLRRASSVRARISSMLGKIPSGAPGIGPFARLCTAEDIRPAMALPPALAKGVMKRHSAKQRTMLSALIRNLANEIWRKRHHIEPPLGTNDFFQNRKVSDFE